MDGVVFLFLFIALAVGFWLGRFGQTLWRRPPPKLLAHARYAEGLRQLLNEQHDAAIDTLVAALDVKQETLETHFALGALWRRRGEVDRAIRIHQNILARPGLKTDQLQHAQLELALDYTRSGLLDRAEALLQELRRDAAIGIQGQALRELVYLYQEEREWEKAIQHAELLCQMKPKNNVEFWRHLQAHYCCELADSSAGTLVDSEASTEANLVDLLVVKEPPIAVTLQAGPIAHPRLRRWAAQALQFEPKHARALLLQSQLEFAEGNLTDALKSLATVRIDGRNLMVVLPPLIRVYRALGRQEELWLYFTELYQDHPVVALIPVLAQFTYEKSGNAAALEFVVQELRGRDDLVLPGELLDVCGPKNFDYHKVRPILSRGLPFIFQCEACGFEGKYFYWCCPTCKHWL